MINMFLNTCKHKIHVSIITNFDLIKTDLFTAAVSFQRALVVAKDSSVLINWKFLRAESSLYCGRTRQEY